MKKLLLLTFFMLTNICAATADGILPDVITVKVGETVDLWSFVTLPDNLDPVGTNYHMDWQWEDPNGYFQIVQGSYWAEVTGLKATPSNTLLLQNISVSAWNVFGYPSYWGSSVIKVVAPDIQKITVVNKEITVNVGDATKLAELLDNAIQLTPT